MVVAVVAGRAASSVVGVAGRAASPVAVVVKMAAMAGLLREGAAWSAAPCSRPRPLRAHPLPVLVAFRGSS
jgi:hypothetical protein